MLQGITSETLDVHASPRSFPDCLHPSNFTRYTRRCVKPSSADNIRSGWLSCSLNDVSEWVIRCSVFDWIT